MRRLRGVAVLIALVGVIDPAITSAGRTRPTVAVVTDGASAVDPLADRVGRELASRFTVVRGPFGGASAVVSVGDGLPSGADAFRSPAFAVTAAGAVPSVRITGVVAPAHAADQARVPISAGVRVTGARGRTLEVTLRQAGLVVDRVTRTIAGDADATTIELGFVPTGEGAVALTVGAGVGPAAPPATADVVVDVRRRPWTVLFVDRRPSWMSTFVRRALESDPRFIVTSRVVTSRNVSTDTGRPPATFEELPPLALFDAVAIGAPEALTDRDVTGLEAFLRRRGGAVCLLFDQRAAGPYERLLNTRDWATAGTSSAVAIDGLGGAGRLMASEIAWPTRLPAGARPIATSTPASGDRRAERPVVWDLPIGSGRIVVSGALDAWRTRDAAPPAFDRFWRGLFADAAEASPPLVDVRVERALLAPGDTTDAIITLRDVALGADVPGRPVSAEVSVVLDTPAGPNAVRAWPDGPAGRFRATLRAPDTPGQYHLAVVANGTRVETPIVVADTPARPSRDERDLLAAWTASRGGIVVPAARSSEIGPAIERALTSESRMTTWHPMRSGWWILPFALCLGADWWARRRQGQR